MPEEPRIEVNNEWTVSEVPELRGFTVEWEEPGRCIFSRRNDLYQATSALDPNLSRIGSVPAKFWQTLGAKVRVVQRALRHQFYNVRPLSDHRLFVTFNRSVGVVENGKYQPLQGLARPCRVLRNAIAADNDGHIYFGEYLSNAERGPMRIYRFRRGEDAVEVAHEFAPGEIRHVHGVYSDPYSDYLWCMTGDLDGESRVMRTRDGFSTFEIVGSGDETWRAVSPLFDEHCLYYAMDAEFRTNHAFRLDRSDGTRTKLGDLDGPVYYTINRGNAYFFAVTAELCPSQHGRSASLWQFTENSGLQKLHSIEKDSWPLAFLPGTMHFPGGPGDPDYFHFHCVGLKRADAKVFVVKRA